MSMLKGSRLCLKHLARYNTLQSRCYSPVSSSNTNSDQKEHNASRDTHFGFQTVSEEEKESRVYEVFHNVADTYDVMNDVMSGGIHRVWKDYFIEKLGPQRGTKLIDVAGGTGDIAFRFLQYVDNAAVEEEDDFLENLSDDHFDVNIPREEEAQGYVDPVERTRTDSSSSDSSEDSSADEGPVDQGQKKDKSESQNSQEFLSRDTHVTVCDINQAMLDVGKKRAVQQGYTKGMSWLLGNAECLPIADDTYDAYTIAFGIRNTTHIDRVLSEAYRVLRPGGRFMCLEFSEVGNTVLRRIYDEYSFQVIPVMGKVIAGDWNSYQYLVESIRKFPNQTTFAGMIKDAGFRAVTHEDLMFGIAAIHSGFKL